MLWHRHPRNRSISYRTSTTANGRNKLEKHYRLTSATKVIENKDISSPWDSDSNIPNYEEKK